MNQPTLSSDLKFEAFALSDIGLARKNNEDFFLLDKESGFFALADGMGGHNAGEIAAEEAIVVVSEKIRDTLGMLNNEIIEEMVFHLKNCIAYANHHVYLRSKSHPTLHGMGTTFCCLLRCRSQLIFAHVGDSRIYRYRKKLTLLTRDHSLRTKALMLGKPTQNLLKPRWGRNIVTRSIGTSPRVDPEMGWEETLPDDIYLLCSDGLTDYVSEEVISDVIANSLDIKNACDNLINIAKSLGGRDNITVVMVKIVT